MERELTETFEAAKKAAVAADDEDGRLPECRLHAFPVPHRRPPCVAGQRVRSRFQSRYPPCCLLLIQASRGKPGVATANSPAIMARKSKGTGDPVSAADYEQIHPDDAFGEQMIRNLED